MNVAILGASDKIDRFSNIAFHSLKKAGHQVFPVSPNFKSLEGTPVFETLNSITAPIDTVTMYVGPKLSSQLVGDIVALKPRRVVFNPGSENSQIEEALTQAGIKVVKACTLVLLDAGRFETA